jgi:hypothetical protein
MTKPVLAGYLQPLHGIPKTAKNIVWHRTYINIGDGVYTYPGMQLAAGRNFEPWDFQLSAEAVNERYSHVVFYLPCRIAPPPFDEDGFTFDTVADFVARLKIPFTTVTESVQTSGYEYDPGLHRKLRPPVVRYLRTLADHSRVVGARGAYSADVLKSLGITNVEVVGCPSLFINGPGLPPGLVRTRPYEELRRIAVGYSNYQKRADSRIGEVMAHAAAEGHHYVEQSFNLLVKARHYPGFITAQDLREAREVFRDLAPLAALFRADRVRYFTNYRLWREHLASMDFVYGARMHGLTPAIQSGVPAAFIVHDARVREMVEWFRLPGTAERDLRSPFRARDLYERCDYRPALAAYPSRYRAFLAFLAGNGLQPQVDAEGRCLDPWEPEPLPEVRRGENRPTSRLDAAFFDLICQMGDHLAATPALEGQVPRLGQSWYESRVAQGEPS